MSRGSPPPADGRTLHRTLRAIRGVNAQQGTRRVRCCIMTGCERSPLPAVRPARAGGEVVKWPAAVMLPPEPDAVLDRFASLAASTLRSPMAVLSLLSSDREIVLPGASGMPAPWQQERVMAWAHSLCRHAAASAELVVVDDVRTDPHAQDYREAVGHFGVGAWIAAPAEVLQRLHPSLHDGRGRHPGGRTSPRPPPGASPGPGTASSGRSGAGPTDAGTTAEADTVANRRRQRGPGAGAGPPAADAGQPVVRHRTGVRHPRGGPAPGRRWRAGRLGCAVRDGHRRPALERAGPRTAAGPGRRCGRRTPLTRADLSRSGRRTADGHRPGRLHRRAHPQPAPVELVPRSVAGGDRRRRVRHPHRSAARTAGCGPLRSAHPRGRAAPGPVRGHVHLPTRHRSGLGAVRPADGHRPRRPRRRRRRLLLLRRP